MPRRRPTVIIPTTDAEQVTVPDIGVLKLRALCEQAARLTRLPIEKVRFRKLELPTGVRPLVEKKEELGKQAEIQSVNTMSYKLPDFGRHRPTVMKQIWKRNHALVKSFRLALDSVYNNFVLDVLRLQDYGDRRVDRREEVLFAFLVNVFHEAYTQDRAFREIRCVRIPELHYVYVHADETFLEVSLVMEFIKFVDFQNNACNEKFERISRQVHRCLRKYRLIHDDLNKGNFGCRQSSVAPGVCHANCAMPVVIDFGDASFQKLHTGLREE